MQNLLLGTGSRRHDGVRGFDLDVGRLWCPNALPIFLQCAGRTLVASELPGLAGQLFCDVLVCKKPLQVDGAMEGRMVADSFVAGGADQLEKVSGVLLL